jgi:lipoprotein-anchoring transpeptidase ErfK/SrfK
MNAPTNMLSRRDFLRLAGCGMLGMAIPDLSPFLQNTETELQGRITDNTLWSHAEPSQNAGRVEMYWRDLVIPITGAVVSEDEDAHNRIWYEVEKQGYVYSGGVQPVQTHLNQPVQEIPARGLLGEISVPYTDAHEEPDPDAAVAHRLYYETVHWIMGKTIGADGQTWYRLLDDKWSLYYYMPARHIRIIPDDELAPLSPEVSNADKLVEVNLTQQLVLAFEGRRMVFASRAATGGQYRSGRWSTPMGEFITSYKRPTRHMAAGDIASSGFDLPGVPWVLYITKSWISFHGTYWHRRLPNGSTAGQFRLSNPATNSPMRISERRSGSSSEDETRHPFLPP